VRALSVIVLFAVVGSGCGVNAPSAPTNIAPSPPSPAAATALASAATPYPTPQSAVGREVQWERIATVANAPDRLGDWRVLGGFLGGYAAIESSPAAVWFSADGIEWTETRLRVPRGTPLQVQAIAGGRAEILLGGSYTPCSPRAYERDPFFECRPRPVSWISSDGRNWRASPPWKGPVGEPGRSGSLFQQLWPVPNGGWDAAQAFDPSDESDGFELRGPAIWHSSDGLAWKPLKGHSGEGTECASDLLSGDVRAAADASGRRVASLGVDREGGCAPPVWTSADGRVYTPVAGFTAGYESVRVVLPPDKGWPWRLLGWVVLTGGQTTEARAWSSYDLATWTTTPLAGRDVPAQIVQSAAHQPGRDIAVSRAKEASITSISDDGIHWQIADGTSPPIETIAAGPAGLLGLIGIWNDAGDAVTGFEVWRLIEKR
jgi:hypothetical protein